MKICWKHFTERVHTYKGLLYKSQSVKTPFRRRIGIPSLAGFFVLIPLAPHPITRLFPSPRVQMHSFNSLVGVGIGIIEISEYLYVKKILISL